jgi:hypothetical protein
MEQTARSGLNAESLTQRARVWPDWRTARSLYTAYSGGARNFDYSGLFFPGTPGMGRRQPCVRDLRVMRARTRSRTR